MKTIFQKIAVFGLAIFTLASQASSATLSNKPVLTLEVARNMVAAAEKKASENHWEMTIVVLDDGGNLICLERMNDAQLGTIEIAQKKAHTAAFFKSPSKAFGEGLAAGTTALLKLDVLPFEGGIPIVANGRVIGAIGVSGGALATQDGQVAQAGIDWLTSNIFVSK